MNKNSEDVTFEELKNCMVDFVSQRGKDWEIGNKRTKNLLLSAFIEMGELAEMFQWKPIDYVPQTEEERKEMAYEFVDVFNYLFMVLHNCEIDFPKYYYEKMERLDNKFPIGQTDEEHHEVKNKYRKTGQNKLYEEEKKD